MVLNEIDEAFFCRREDYHNTMYFEEDLIMQLLKKALSVLLSFIIFYFPLTDSFKPVTTVGASSERVVFYDRNKAVAYADYFWDKVCSDGKFYLNKTGAPLDISAGTELKNLKRKDDEGKERVLFDYGNDCAHFVSSCIGEPQKFKNAGKEEGGGLSIKDRGGAYGEPGARNLMNFLLRNVGVEKKDISELEPGDVVLVNKLYNSEGKLIGGNHIMLYMGKDEEGKHTISAHTQSQKREQFLKHYSKYEEIVFIHILDIKPPTLSEPRDGATNIRNDVQFSWNAVNNAKKYEIEVLRNKSVIHRSETTFTSYDLPTPVKLESGQSYTWRVKAGNNSNQWTSFSTEWTFTMSGSGGGSNKRPAITITAPKPAEIITCNQSYAITWTEENVTNDVFLWYRNTSNNKKVFIRGLPRKTLSFDWRSPKEAGTYELIIGSGKTNSKLDVETSVMFKVDCSDGGGNKAPTSAPSTLLPACESTVKPGEVTFEWSKVTNATKYEFELYNTANELATRSSYATTSCSWTLGTKAERNLKWRVRAGNIAGWGPWSNYCTFHNEGSGGGGGNPSISITSPSSGSSFRCGETITIRWTASNLKYDIYLWYNDGQSIYIDKTSRTSTSYKWTIPSDLQGSVTITVASGREENNTVYFDTSDEVTIKVTCGSGGGKAPTQMPRLISPCGDAEVTNLVTLSWGSVSDATKYSVAVKRSSDGFFEVDEEVVTSTSYTIPKNLSTGWYTWNVRAGNNTGWGPWTTPACRFYVKSSSGGGGNPSISITSPSSGSSFRCGETITIRWTASNLKNDIYFWYKKTTSDTWIYIGKTSRSNTSYNWPLPSDLGSGDYDIFIGSGEPDSNGNFRSFDAESSVRIKLSCGSDGGGTDPRNLPAPTHRSPPNNSSGVPSKYEWYAVSGAEYYGLYIRDMTTGKIVYDSEEDGFVNGKIYSTSHSPVLLIYWGERYRWNMRAGAKGVWSNNFSDPWYFTVPKSSSQSIGSLFFYNGFNKQSYPITSIYYDLLSSYSDSKYLISKKPCNLNIADENQYFIINGSKKRFIEYVLIEKE